MQIAMAGRAAPLQSPSTFMHTAGCSSLRRRAGTLRSPTLQGPTVRTPTVPELRLVQATPSTGASNPLWWGSAASQPQGLSHGNGLPSQQQQSGASSMSILATAVSTFLFTTSLIASVVYSALLSTASGAINWHGALPHPAQLTLPKPAPPAASSAQAPAATTPTTRPASSVAAATPALVDTAAPVLASWVRLHTTEQFDAFVISANRAGYLVVVLFHGAWCAASQRTEHELERTRNMWKDRRVVYAHVECPPPQADGRRAQLPPSLDLARAHRLHKTPTTRMYYNSICLDEVVGCRPVELRQTTADLLFKYAL